MTGGITKTSTLALLAAMGLAGGAISAQAADLGGNCCADLEERVAELEATTARKGNRKVSLTVSGWVNEAIMYWDDGRESNAYQATNFFAQSRFRFVGSAKINAAMTAGYLMEIGINGANSQGLNRTNDDGTPNALSVRHSAWWLQHKDLGKVWVGQTSTATDGITEINLANTAHMATPTSTVIVGGFSPQRNGAYSGFTFTNMWGNDGTGMIGEGIRANIVKYESPALAGFIVSAAAGEDDLWDVALRYAGEFSGFKLAFGVGYGQLTDVTGNSGTAATNNRTNSLGCFFRSAASQDVSCTQLGLSGSIMHVPTGLYVSGAYGSRDDDNAKTAVLTAADDNHTMWYVQAGIEQNWTGLGKSTLFGEYQQISHGFFVSGAGTFAAAETTMWGIGFNQSIDAAAMDLYVSYHNYSAETWTATATGAKAVGGKTSFDDFQTIVAGGRIQF